MDKFDIKKSCPACGGNTATHKYDDGLSGLFASLPTINSTCNTCGFYWESRPLNFVDTWKDLIEKLK